MFHQGRPDFGTFFGRVCITRLLETYFVLLFIGAHNPSGLI